MDANQNSMLRWTWHHNQLPIPAPIYLQVELPLLFGAAFLDNPQESKQQPKKQKKDANAPLSFHERFKKSKVVDSFVLLLEWSSEQAFQKGICCQRYLCQILPKQQPPEIASSDWQKHTINEYLFEIKDGSSSNVLTYCNLPSAALQLTFQELAFFASTICVRGTLQQLIFGANGERGLLETKCSRKPEAKQEEGKERERHLHFSIRLFLLCSRALQLMDTLDVQLHNDLTIRSSLPYLSSQMQIFICPLKKLDVCECSSVSLMNSKF
jgi:hypothetical protein